MKENLLHYLREAKPSKVWKLFDAYAMRKNGDSEHSRAMYFEVQRAIYSREQQVRYLERQQDAYSTLQQDGYLGMMRLAYMERDKDRNLAKQMDAYSAGQEKAYSEEDETVFWALLEDRDCLLTALIKNPHILHLLPDHIKNDEDLVFAVVQQNGLALQYASDELRKNERVVRAALAQNGMALKFVLEPLASKIEIVLAAVEQNGFALQYTGTFKSNKDVVMAATAQNGAALELADETLRNDEDLIAVSKFGTYPVLNTLLPLKEKLRNETNTEVAGIMQKMISSMEKSMITVGQDHDVAHFMDTFNTAIIKAQPELEKQRGWRSLVDAVANLVVDLVKAAINGLLAKAEGSPQKEIASTEEKKNPFSFFANPNPVKEELERIQKRFEEQLDDSHQIDNPEDGFKA